MNLTRKLIKMVDLRMHQFVAGEKMTMSSRLHRVHSIESLALDHHDYQPFSAVKKTAGSPCF